MSVHSFCELFVTEEDIWISSRIVYHLPLACYCGGGVEWDVQTFVAENICK